LSALRAATHPGAVSAYIDLYPLMRRRFSAVAHNRPRTARTSAEWSSNPCGPFGCDHSIARRASAAWLSSLSFKT
jgi:hypothetical protein